jgi:hypothetical protein
MSPQATCDETVGKNGCPPFQTALSGSNPLVHPVSFPAAAAIVVLLLFVLVLVIAIGEMFDRD